MREVIINGKWPLNLPDSSAGEWEGNMASHGEWEPERLNALHTLIKPGTIVMYIGAYKGDMPGLLATWGAKLIIVEASPGFWSLIKQTWYINSLPKPLGCFSGLMSDTTTNDFSKEQLTNWPTRSEMFVEGTTGFSHLAESGGQFPEITIDDFVQRTAIVPDIITMDIEGSELQVLHGGEKTLLKYEPTLLLSVHPEFMFHNHGVYERELHDFVRDRKYIGTWLGYDHEHHWLYSVENNT